jgi:hypothetical protein
MKCPQCRRGSLEVHEGLTASRMMPTFYVRGTALRVQLRPVTFVSCNACEYCCEQRACTDSPACARAGCADCRRSYGPRKR